MTKPKMVLFRHFTAESTIVSASQKSNAGDGCRM